MTTKHGEEVWRQVPGFGGHYEASSLGRIRSLERTIVRPHSTTGRPVNFTYKMRILRCGKADKTGHPYVTLGFDGQAKTVAVHTLVLLAFVGPRPDGMEACHNNGIAWDNRPENLRWDTHAANNADRKKHGTYAVGARHHMARLSEDDVRAILASGLGCVAASKAFDISISQAHRILTRQSWRHL